MTHPQSKYENESAVMAFRAPQGNGFMVVRDMLKSFNTDIREFRRDFNAQAIDVRQVGANGLTVEFNMQCLSDWFARFTPETGIDSDTLSFQFLTDIREKAQKMGVECTYCDIPVLDLLEP